MSWLLKCIYLCLESHNSIEYLVFFSLPAGRGLGDIDAPKLMGRQVWAGLPASQEYFYVVVDVLDGDLTLGDST